MICRCGRSGLVPWVGKIPWRMEWELTPVFLSAESHRQRSLVDYSPWGPQRAAHNSATTLSREHKTYYVKFICAQSVGCWGFIFSLTNYWFFLETGEVDFLRIKTFQMLFWWKWILCRKCPWIFKIYRKIGKDRYYIISLLFWETITFFLYSLMKINKISKQYTTKIIFLWVYKRDHF